MKQLTVEPKKVKKTDVSGLVQEFNETSNKTLPLTRTVKLLYKSCCGCGCSDVEIKREVPYDSPLQNGDRVTKTIAGDTLWE